MAPAARQESKKQAHTLLLSAQKHHAHTCICTPPRAPFQCQISISLVTLYIQRSVPPVQHSSYTDLESAAVHPKSPNTEPQEAWPSQKGSTQRSYMP